VNNPYKRMDVFRCPHGAHQRFDGKVSAFHVLKEKKCWPSGCLYFLWRCVRLEKGGRCPQKYKVPGRKCTGCTHYDEDKLHFQPDLILAGSARNAFLEDIETFDAWLQKASSVRQAAAGRISTVKPWFEKTVYPDASRIHLRGYLLVMKRGFIGMSAFDDTFYVRVSRNLMLQHHFVPKMKLEFTGELREDRGRIVLLHPKSVEVLTRGWGRLWTDEKALVSVKTATLLKDQPDRCLACPWSALADVTDLSDDDEKKYRNLFCLKGVADSDACTISAMKKLRKESVLL
jgi:hypothetical protein